MSRSVSPAEVEQVLAAVRSWGDRGTASKIASTLRDKVPARTLTRWLSQLVREGRLIRCGASSGTRYALSTPADGNGGAPVAVSGAAAFNCRAGSPYPADPAPSDSDGPDRIRPVAPAGSSVSYNRALLDAYHPNEMAYLTEPQRMNLMRRAPQGLETVGRGLRIPPSVGAPNPAGPAAPPYQGRGRARPLGAPDWENENPAGYGDPALHQSAQPAPAPAPGAALSPEWQRFAADLVTWSRDAHVDLGFAPRRHRRVLAPSVVAAVVARADVPTMAGELRRIWNHRDAVAAVLTLTQTSGQTWSTVTAVQSALTRPPAPAAPTATSAARAGAPSGSVAVAPVSLVCRPLCRAEPLNLSGTTYRPTTDAALIEPCLRQILLTAAAIQDPAEASFFTFAHLLLLLPFDAENLSSAVLLGNVPLIRTHLAPVSLATVPSADLRVAVLSWWQLGNPTPLSRLWSRPIAAPAR